MLTSISPLPEKDRYFRLELKKIDIRPRNTGLTIDDSITLETDDLFSVFKSFTVVFKEEEYMTTSSVVIGSVGGMPISKYTIIVPSDDSGKPIYLGLSFKDGRLNHQIPEVLSPTDYKMMSIVVSQDGKLLVSTAEKKRDVWVKLDRKQQELKQRMELDIYVTENKPGLHWKF